MIGASSVVTKDVSDCELKFQMVNYVLSRVLVSKDGLNFYFNYSLKGNI
jgi:hypothetical protein